MGCFGINHWILADCLPGIFGGAQLFPRKQREIQGGLKIFPRLLAAGGYQFSLYLRTIRAQFCILDNRPSQNSSRKLCLCDNI